MDNLATTQRYFDAWNARDIGAILATFVEGGTYADSVSGLLSGVAIGAYVSGLFEAFPDLVFEVSLHAQVAENVVAAQWVMRGTNTGPFRGLPPTGKAICVQGADFILTEGGRIRTVQGYFDSRAVPDQLGLQVIVQPYSVGPVAFGYSAAMQGGKRGTPGAFSMTSLQVRSDREGQEVYEHSRMILRDVAKMDGFVGALTANVGQRYYTAVAWEDLGKPQQIDQSDAHRQIVDRLYNTDFAVGGAFGVWAPVRQRYLVRCPQCSKLSDYAGDAARCACGEALPEPQPYW